MSQLGGGGELQHLAAAEHYAMHRTTPQQRTIQSSGHWALVSHAPELLGVQNNGGMGSGSEGVGSLERCGENDRFMQIKDRMKPTLAW